MKMCMTVYTAFFGGIILLDNSSIIEIRTFILNFMKEGVF